MSFYSGAPFFGTLILLLLFALILGCMERSLRWYNLIVSGVMVVCVLG
jgi:membrane protein involved in D-alanine export